MKSIPNFDRPAGHAVMNSVGCAWAIGVAIMLVIDLMTPKCLHKRKLPDSSISKIVMAINWNRYGWKVFSIEISNRKLMI